MLEPAECYPRRPTSDLRHPAVGGFSVALLSAELCLALINSRSTWQWFRTALRQLAPHSGASLQRAVSAGRFGAVCRRSIQLLSGGARYGGGHVCLLDDPSPTAGALRIVRRQAPSATLSSVWRRCLNGGADVNRQAHRLSGQLPEAER